MNLDGLVGKEMVSPWREVTQEQVTAFADVTGDRQWIHVDGDRARRESPYGGTIAHGFYTLSMASRLLRDAVGAIEGARVWFCSDEHTTFASEAALPVGARVRIWPAHVDPTVAYHERIWLVSGEDVVGELPVDLRGW